MAKTLKDIAKMVGVSESTVSLALSDSKLIKDITKQKIKTIAKEIGYSPNIMAKNLAIKANNTIGLIIPEIESAYYSRLVKIINNKIRDVGYDFILAITNNSQRLEKAVIENFIQQRIEGMLIVPVNKHVADTKYYQYLKQQEIPYVFLTSFYPTEQDSVYVMVDLEEGSYKLVKYLLDLQHKDILFMCMDSNVISTSYRIDGYIRAFKEKGISYDKNNFIFCEKIDYDFAYMMAKKLIDSKRKFDAIITINDEMALGVINSLNSEGIKVPEQVSVAGYDNTLFSTISHIPITTISQDLISVGNKAVDMLVNEIKKIDIIERRIKVIPELIVRGSTGINKS